MGKEGLCVTAKIDQGRLCVQGQSGCRTQPPIGTAKTLRHGNVSRKRTLPRRPRPSRHVCPNSLRHNRQCHSHLDRFLQAYAVEKAKLEARNRGHSVTEQSLSDGSIKLTVQVTGGGA